ncbi:hypothetical protein H0A61_02873 [Koleobacter methoxysyntrophicus]|jgi:transcriptional regulator with XRE-family HTH domain|uniref:Uncharacterized protein n=1 Tax=Koleobacter methoxysyntrophicus TaxID=2751313 RepID=A0A8A0RPY7_9FIRM|nr:hypothetical protein [Koleobacter methoxysyntrophicus]QSQ10465.1 hypothetical protein H0A61_02873 [Koleobacter methoxysyntrophicus]
MPKVELNSETLKKIFAKNLKKLFSGKTATQIVDEIHQKTGKKVAKSTILSYIRGEYLPTKTKLKMLSEYSGRPVEWFFTDHDKALKMKDEIAEALKIKRRFPRLFRVLARSKTALTTEEEEKLARVVKELIWDHLDHSEDIDSAIKELHREAFDMLEDDDVY